MKIIKNTDPKFYNILKNTISNRNLKTDKQIDKNVKKIIKEVKKYGDSALVNFTKKFDKVIITKEDILISKKIRNSYKLKVDRKVINSFKIAIKNITKFHLKQLPKNYKIKKNGVLSGSEWKSIDSVGLYVPGGMASYPSSFLMSVIPAIVAGVKRIVVTTPSSNGEFNPYLMELLNILKIKEVYQVGGAQAIAALTYGTDTIKPVDKIFGPGNSYVMKAKKQVFGEVGIDLLAGPSEIVVVADKFNNPKWVASDLIAQAEHDEEAQCILITNNDIFAKKVIHQIKIISSKLSRDKIIKKSIKNYGLAIILNNFKAASSIINFIAPEHLHLQNKNFNNIFRNIKNSGCIFLGRYSSEAFGDYIVGTNHILPTSGSARFSSGLGVIDFMKRNSYVMLNKESHSKFSTDVENMALVEKLDGHRFSVQIRKGSKFLKNK